jgi:DNA-binding MarR family transcriptional regulator
MEPLETQVGFDVVRLLLRCHRLEKGLASSAGLTVDEFHCLSQIYLHAPRCVKDLCGLTGFHPTRVSRLLNSLEAKGYLTRSLGSQDHRKELLTLTRAGIGAARSLVLSCAVSGRSLVEGPLRDAAESRVNQ